MARALLYLAFVCSGAAALIYEITWTRLLTLFMGHTVAAASTVLAAFMGGLAVGAAIAGRLAPRLDRPAAMRVYAATEIAVAVLAVALPFELRVFEPLLTAAYDDGNGGAAFALTRLFCALAVVTLPAVAMGATLPLAVRWLAASASHAGRDTGLLYAANTVGAAAGAILSGFVLLPALGMRATTFVGVVLNALAAALAWRMAALHVVGGEAPRVPSSATTASRATASADTTLPVGTAQRRTSASGTVPIGRAPIGRAPIGRAPVGRAPVGRAPAGTVPHAAASAHAVAPPVKAGNRAALAQSSNVAAKKKASARHAQPDVGTDTSPPMPRTAAIALAASGCMSLVLQIAWTRILALVVGPTTFAFSAMVATFITGIALGAAMGGWLARPRRGAGRPSPVLLAGSLLVAGLAAAAAAAWAPEVPLVLSDAVSAPDASFGTVVRLQSALIAALMLPMTIAFGMAFPLAVALSTREDTTVSRDVARVYAANTAGAIVGALAGGFVLVPAFGLQGTVRIAAAALCLWALGLGGWAWDSGLGALGPGHGALGSRLSALVSGRGLRQTRDQQRPKTRTQSPKPRAQSPETRTRRRGAAAAITVALAAAALAAIAAMPPWDREILSSGAYKYAPYMQDAHRDALLRAGRLLYYREGAAATVSVRSVTGSISLAIDGKVDASNAGDMLTQRLLAHLPLLLHPAPRHVAVVGLGSGVTLGSALRHPIARADVLEISPEVVEASRFFERENHRALADPRTRLIVGDGRSHLTLGTQAYDVIISEPSNPWMAGVAALFTREFFQAARSRLAPGGILCQWAHTYDIGDEDLRSIAATFTSVFPDAALWLVGDGDVLFIGSPAPIGPRLAGIRSAWMRDGVAADLADVEVRDPDTLLTLFTAEGARLKAYARDAPIERDDWMRLEFSAPRGIYGRSTADNAAALRALATMETLPAVVQDAWRAPATLRHRGAMHVRAEAFRAAYDDYARALERQSSDAAAVDGLVRAAAGAQRAADAEAILTRALERDPSNISAAVALSRLIAARGDLERATAPLRPFLAGSGPADAASGTVSARTVSAGTVSAGTASGGTASGGTVSADAATNVRAMDQLASIFADAGDVTRLAAIVGDLERAAPGSEPALYYAASLHFLADRPADAVAAGEQLRARNARHARGLNLLGAAYATLGRRDEAQRAFEASIAADPREPAAYANLGTFELQAGRPARAAEYFAEALTLDPSSAAAQQGLAQAIAAQGAQTRAMPSGRD